MTFNREHCQNLLQEGLISLDLQLSLQQINDLLDYVYLLHRWNQAYNLSAVRDPAAMVSRHLLDSLTIVPFLKDKLENTPRTKYLLDVGSGGGLPGVPIAITCPELFVTLLDSNGKKARFLFQVKTSLSLRHVTIENKRVEQFQAVNKFDIVTSRAYATLDTMVKQTKHVLAVSGEYWAMKGLYPEQELNECKSFTQLLSVDALKVPSCDGERHLVRFVV